jgi:hypothetical protein
VHSSYLQVSTFGYGWYRWTLRDINFFSVIDSVEEKILRVERQGVIDTVKFFLV